MPLLLLKPRASQDFFVLWSTDTRQPATWGTRKELEERYAAQPDAVAPARFRRTNTNGTSHAGGLMGYDTTKIDVMGKVRYTLNRVDLEPFCRALELFVEDEYGEDLERPEVRKYLQEAS